MGLRSEKAFIPLLLYALNAVPEIEMITSLLVPSSAFCWSKAVTDSRNVSGNVE